MTRKDFSSIILIAPYDITRHVRLTYSVWDIRFIHKRRWNPEKGKVWVLRPVIAKTSRLVRTIQERTKSKYDSFSWCQKMVAVFDCGTAWRSLSGFSHFMSGCGTVYKNSGSKLSHNFDSLRPAETEQTDVLLTLSQIHHVVCPKTYSYKM